MLVGECAGCSRPVDRRFRFCPWCGVAQRRKLTDFFLGLEGQALRVSRYLAEDERQVRLSVWNERGEAEAAVSLEDDEADRLAEFLAQSSFQDEARRRGAMGGCEARTQGASVSK